MTEVLIMIGIGVAIMLLVALADALIDWVNDALIGRWLRRRDYMRESWTVEEWGDLDEYAYDPTPRLDTPDTLKGIDKFARLKRDCKTEGEEITMEVSIEDAPIEEHPRFNHICKISPWHRERVARSGGAWVDETRLKR